jgi:hypothetical protein
MQGTTTIVFYNKSRTFTAGDVQSGVFQAWLEETYAWWLNLSPCSTNQSSTTNTQTTTQNTTSNATNAANNATNSTNTGSTSTNTSSTNTTSSSSSSSSNTNSGSSGSSGGSGDSGGSGTGGGGSGDSGGDSGGGSGDSGGGSGSDGSDGGSGSGGDGGDGGDGGGGDSGDGGSGDGSDGGDGGSGDGGDDGGSGDGGDGDDGSGDGDGDGGDKDSSEEKKQEEKKEEEKKEEEKKEEEKKEESEEEKKDEEKEESDEESEEDSEEESDEEESDDEESEDDEEEEDEETSDNEDEEEEDEDEKKKRKLAPPIVSANLMTMQMIDGTISTAASFGMSQSSLTGVETYSYNAMIWSNMKQFMIGGSLSTVWFNYDKEIPYKIRDPETGKEYTFGIFMDKGSIRTVDSHAVNFMYMYGTTMASYSYSQVYLGQKENFWKGFVGGYAATVSIMNSFGQVSSSTSITGFGTKPFIFEKLPRWTFSPMLALSLPVKIYPIDLKLDPLNNFTYITGMSTNFKLTQRFVANLGINAISNTDPLIPTTFAATIGARFQFF